MRAPKEKSSGPKVNPWQAPAICLALAAMTFAVFGQTLTDNFVDYDDNAYVYDNSVVAQGLTFKGFLWAFSGHADNWHPLTWFSHMLDCQIYGLNPMGHHLTNVILHAATVIALFLVLRQMTGTLWRSAFVAAVFAIHPLRVESVAWVAERKDVLSGLFFVLTIGAYVRYVKQNYAKFHYVLSVLFFTLGLMSKPMLVTLPLVLLLVDYWPLRRVGPVWRLAMEKLPFVLLSAASCVATLLAQTSVIQRTASFPLTLRLANAMVAGAVYFGQMVWPTGLVVFYPYPQNGLPSWELALAGLLLAGLSAMAWRERRKRPWLLMGWLWYSVMLLPVIGIIQVGRQSHADRYTYLPQIGLYMALTWLAAEWFTRVRTAAVFAIAVITALMICAWHQTTYWQDTETLWNRDLACTTNNDKAHYALGLDLLQKGKVDDAIPQLEEAIRIRSDNEEAHLDLGIALDQKGKFDQAILHYQEALKIAPDNPLIQDDLGSTLQKDGKLEEAIAHYREALKISPNYADAHNNLGFALLAIGRRDEAVAEFQKALQLEPNLKAAQHGLAMAGSASAPSTKPGVAGEYFKLGDALMQDGKLDEAIAQFRHGLQLEPGSAQVHLNLGLALLQNGSVDESIPQFQAALQIKPDYAAAYYNLGNAFFQQGKAAEAIRAYQQALQINPGAAAIYNTLGAVFLQSGKLDEAIANFQKGLRLDPAAAPAHLNLGIALLQKGLTDGAIVQFQAAIRVKTNYAAAYYNLGIAFFQTGKLAEAIRDYQQAMQLKPTDPEARNNLAWILATCPDASLRNGSKAVELARQANQLTGSGNPITLHTLAAALAETGQFAEARRLVQKAIDLARASGQQDLADQFSGELRQYEAGRPLGAAVKK